MTPEQFMECFGVVAEAEGGIAKLRELVLTLAMRGSLLSPNERVAHWTGATVGQLVSFRQELIRPADNVNENVLFVGPEHIERNSGRRSGGEPTHTSLLGGRKFRFSPGQIVYTYLRPYLNKCWLADVEGVCSVDQYVLVPDEQRVLPKFLCLFMLSPPFVEQANRLTHGLMLPRLRSGLLSHVEVSLPSIPEQHRIVAKVDQLMSMLDDLEQRQERKRSAAVHVSRAALDSLVHAEGPDELARAWERVSKILGVVTVTPRGVVELKDAILSMCMDGRLTPRDDRSDAAGAVSRAMSQVASLEADSRGRSRKSGADTTERVDALAAVPENWCWARLGLVASISGGLQKGKALTGQKTISLPYLRVANVQRWRLDLGVIKEILVPVDDVDRYRVLPNDILLTEGGDWDKLGRAAIWRGEIELCLHQNHVFRVRTVTDEIVPEWIEAWCNCRIGREYFQRASKQTTNLASINMTQLRSLPIPIPPVAEQREMLARFASFSALVGSIEVKINKKSHAVEKLVAAAAFLE